MRYLRTIVLLSFALPAAGCIEYGINPLWKPSLFQRLECDAEADRQAAPEDRPIAVCDADQLRMHAIHDVTTLRGKSSYDPSGLELIGYDWQLVDVPAGSAAQLRDDDQPDRRFRPDVVGQYVAELTVINEECITSDPCRVVVDAVPAQDLWVEMYWSHSGDDMDLHLLREDARRESMGDCHYGNCVGRPGLDWDARGELADDPSLDLDDIDGTGPENINIFEPAASFYTVAVHDYPGTIRDRPTDVTVRIYLAGELAFEEERTIEGEDRFVELAEIAWDDLEVIPL